MSRRKSSGETETLPQRSVRVPLRRSGIATATGSDRNETDRERERRGAMIGKERKDVGTEAAGRELLPEPRFEFVSP